MYVEDTIVASATPPGSGGVAIVRLSGPHSFRVARQIWRAQSFGDLKPRHLYLGDIIDPETDLHLDRAMAVFFPRPHSFTGEDVAELHCHGGRYLTRRVVSLAIRLGARMADPGEFSRRAFINGEMDLTEVEAVADLIDARSDIALRQATAQLTGVLREKIEGLRHDLVSIRAHLEAEIDFSEEDIALPSRSEIASSIGKLLSDVAILHDSYARGRLIREGPRLSIVGKPNVGKSSILNLLLGTDRAIVTSVPGTTRDIIEDSLQLGPYALVIQDTAGIRHSLDEVEKIGIERSRTSVASADLVLAVFDASAPLTSEDAAVATLVDSRSGIALLNKSDLPPQASMDDLRAHGLRLPILPFSATRADGLDLLKSELAKAIEALNGPAHGDQVTISHERHRDALARALDALAAAKLSSLQSMPPEVVAVDVTRAAEALGQITGEIHTEDVLDAVFREFCIGK